MHGGFLTGGSFCDYRELDPTRPADADKLRWRQAFLEACRELNVDPFHVAVRFGMGLPGIRSVALSTSQPHRVGALVDAVQAPVSPAVWEELLRRGLTQVVPAA
jgi:D-threo-aldose 1-dehydrogenase